jgi:hypothetical protein
MTYAGSYLPVPFGGVIVLGGVMSLMVLAVGILLMATNRASAGRTLAVAGVLGLGATIFGALILTWTTPNGP